MKRDVDAVLVRLPPDVKRWLTTLCNRNLTSYSSQLTIILRAKMDRKDVTSRGGPFTPQGVRHQPEGEANA